MDVVTADSIVEHILAGLPGMSSLPARLETASRRSLPTGKTTHVRVLPVQCGDFLGWTLDPFRRSLRGGGEALPSA